MNRESHTKISVIIPVFNSSLTLTNCIESIRKQTYHNLEIILIDDCSDDGSYDICKNYQYKDKRIKVFKNNINQGVSKTRNIGICHATGEFIAFVDSDDTIEPQMYEKMLNSLIEYDADICICQFRIKDHINDEPRSFVDISYEGIYDDSYDLIRILYNGHNSVYKDTLIQSVLNKVYKRRIFKDVYFMGTFGEDCYISNQIFSKHCKVCIMNNEFYNYYFTSNSASLSHTATNKERIIFLDILAERTDIYDDRNIKKESMKKYCDLYLTFLRTDEIRTLIDQDNYLLRFKKYMQDLLFHEGISNELSIKQKLKWSMAYISPRTYRLITTYRKQNK